MPDQFTAAFNLSAFNVFPVYHAAKSSAGNVRIPVGRSRDTGQVEFGTAFTIVLSFLYLLYMSFKTAYRIHQRVKEE